MHKLSVCLVQPSEILLGKYGMIYQFQLQLATTCSLEICCVVWARLIFSLTLMIILEKISQRMWSIIHPFESLHDTEHFSESNALGKPKTPLYDTGFFVQNH